MVIVANVVIVATVVIVLLAVEVLLQLAAGITLLVKMIVATAIMTDETVLAADRLIVNVMAIVR